MMPEFPSLVVGKLKYLRAERPKPAKKNSLQIPHLRPYPSKTVTKTIAFECEFYMKVTRIQLKKHKKIVRTLK